MRIVHFGPGPTPNEVNGVTAVVWKLAAAQSSLGHEVALLMGSGSPVAESVSFCQKLGLQDLWVSVGAFGYDERSLLTVLRSYKPDVVHFHSTFVSAHATASWTLFRGGFPYVISTHGGYSPQVFQRSPWKKWPYFLLIEKPRLCHATAILPLTGIEQKDVFRLAGPKARVLEPVVNPIEVPPDASWSGDPANCRTVVTLTRFDVFQKGLDRILALGRLLPDVAFHIYGVGEQSKELRDLIAAAPANVAFRSPVFSEEKWRVLTSASLYLQSSRWEGFSVSTAESLALGLPCAILPGREPLSELVDREKTGFALADHLPQAATQISQILDDRDARRQRGARAARYARDHWSPATVARAIVDRYRLGN